MKKILHLLFFITLSAQAQVDNYDYLYFCDQMIANTNNSVDCLQKLYRDLKEFKKNPDFRFRYFESYICIRQPDQKAYDKIKGGPNNFFKTVDNELWKLYNDCYAKNGEIVAYLRLQDYKTDLDKGFALVRELQQLQIAIGKTRDKIAAKVVADAKSMPASGNYIKPYQLLLKAIVHEEDLILRLSQNFNEDIFIGYPQEEVLKSFLEADNLLKNLTADRFAIPDRIYLKDCIEGLHLIQETKQHSLDRFNNTSTFDGRYTNSLYDNLQNYFNNDILHFFANFSAQGRLNYYPAVFRAYDFDAPPKPWALTHLNYSLPSLDSISITKQPAPLPVASFNQLNDIVYYIDECVLSMESLFKALRSEESTWRDLAEGDMPYKNPLMKFERFVVPVSLYGHIIKESDQLPAAYRKGLVDQLTDVEQIMLSIQDHLMELSQYMSRGDFRGKNMDYLNSKLKTIETLYTQLDLRKEKLFMQTRKAYASFPPKKPSAWTVTSGVLLKATDNSRSILRKMELKLYEHNESPVSVAAIHESQRDMIVNQLKYMNGIARLDNSGLSPYVPYEYIPDYLKTLEEKVTELPAKIENVNKAYGDFLYMHNIIVEQYNKFTLLGLNDDEHATYDPLRPVYLLLYIRQPPKFHYEAPSPKEEKKEEVKEPEVLAEPVVEISFDGYAFNNLVLLLDVSSSMNKPERLPLLKESFQQLVRYMRKEDQVSIVIYSGKAKLHLPSVSASDTTKIMNAIQSLRSEGNTNIADGLALAYKTANNNFIEGGNNKIIMATDGEFNTGESLYRLVEKNSSKIVLSVFDFSQLPDPLKGIQQMAEKGNGNYVKVTSGNSLQVLASEAQKEKQ
ncbi:MAG: VWA domain-containing protein [Bacteroidota bacterium]